jgi:hypothetical protein
MAQTERKTTEFIYFNPHLKGGNNTKLFVEVVDLKTLERVNTYTIEKSDYYQNKPSSNPQPSGE